MPKLRERRFSNFEVVRSDEVSLDFFALVRCVEVAPLGVGKERVRWVQGSDVPAKYVHLSGRDLDDAYDQMHGLYEPDEEEQQPDVCECPRCQELNEPNAAFCMRCGFALDHETAAEIEEQAEQDVKDDYRETDPGDTETVELLDAFDDALDDPEFKEELLKRIAD